MSKFYKRLVQPGRPDSPTTISAGGFWTIRDQRLARASGIWPDGVIPNLNYLVVGGGGAGGDSVSLQRGGGGGAGGLLNDTFTAYNANTYTITIGAGGTAVNDGSGNNGGNSVLSNGSTNIITAYGGGGGGYSPNNGNNGASGGGGGEGGSSGGGYHLGGKGVYPGSTYINAPRQGYDGGNAQNSPFQGGGGGGAGGPGVGLIRGPGLYINIADGSTIAGTFAQGAGTLDEVITANSGNGGQGSHYNFTGENHNGQDGVVILWWSASYNKPSIITGTYTYSKQNGYHIYKFTGSGSIKF